MYICEKCGKEVYEKFGSGRFCSRSCANGRPHTEEQKQNISNGLKKETICHCQFCGEEFNTLILKSRHEIVCELNPNKKLSVNYGAISNHNKKLNRNVKLFIKASKQYVTLDITNKELEQYRNNHTVCEICGKSIDGLSTPTSKIQYKNLCIDHDHNTNKFRGLLCMTCNRNLGWYENNKDAVLQYLNKK